MDMGKRLHDVQHEVALEHDVKGLEKLGLWAELKALFCSWNFPPSLNALSIKEMKLFE